MEKQFRKIYEEAARKLGVTGLTLIEYLERRLENVVYRLGFAKTRRQARQIVSHGHIAVNGRRVNIASYRVKVGDVVTVIENSKNVELIKLAVEDATPPAWLELDRAAFSGKVLQNPTKDNVILLIGVDIMLKIEKQAKAINITEVKESNYKGQFVIEPLYRGYGHTLGNALRRVLLSSIPGAAIKGMRIEGVLSEFTVMDGVKEAVTEIILNVKEIVIKAESSGERKMTLSVKGPKVVTAADIIADIGVEIINPDQIICTVTTDRTLDMEFLVDTGEGFVVSEEIDRKDWPVDYIAVDAIYTPIRKVSYEVQDTMFGQMTDFDKLTLVVETDGSIEIRDAISYSVELLRLHLDPFLEIGNKMENLREEIEEMIEEPVNVQVIDEKSHDMKIEELDLTVRSFNCLKKAGIEDISQLASLSLNELLKIKNLGKKSLDEILEKMKDLGYDLEKNGSPE